MKYKLIVSDRPTPLKPKMYGVNYQCPTHHCICIGYKVGYGLDLEPYTFMLRLNRFVLKFKMNHFLYTFISKNYKFFVWLSEFTTRNPQKYVDGK